MPAPITCDYTPLVEYADRYTLLWKAPDEMKRVFAKSKPEWEKSIDFDGALRTIQRIADGRPVQGVDAVILNDSHLFVYSVLSPWWQPGERWLTEQFFVRIGRGFTSCAFHAIDLLAEDYRASKIVMATGLAKSDEALGKLYRRFGYSQQSTQHVKEAEWLQSLPYSP